MFVNYLMCPVSEYEGELSREYDSLLSDFHDAFYANNTARMEFVEHIIFIRKVAEVGN